MIDLWKQSETSDGNSNVCVSPHVWWIGQTVRRTGASMVLVGL